jgi:hypothetical protein
MHSILGNREHDPPQPSNIWKNASAPGKVESSAPRRGAQKKGVIWKRTRQSHHAKQDPIAKATKQSDLNMLELSAAAGELDLFYLDRSGFSLWMPETDRYSFKGEQKRQKQTTRKGSRLSILG